MQKVHFTIFLILVIGIGFLFFAFQAPSLSLKNPTITPTPNPLEFPTNLSPVQQNTNQNQQQTQQQQQLQAAIEQIKMASITATITTNKGIITMELYPSDAPITVLNFTQKAKNGFYNNLTFHRVEDWVVQGGDPKGNGTGGGDLPTEFNNRPYVVGSVGVARAADPSVQNDSQFFITKTESSHLNGQYTNFGLVTSGIDVVNSIAIGDKINSITIDEQQATLP